MVIYADVLIIVNLAVNYFILLLTSLLCRIPLPLRRLIWGSLVGAVGSLYILIPSAPAALDVAARMGISGLIVAAAFCPTEWRRFLRVWAVFFAATFLFGGAMLGIYTLFRPHGMAIDGGVVYFDISPILLIVSTTVCYVILRAIQKLGEIRHPRAQRISVRLKMLGREAQGIALIDTGHSLSDPFTGADVVLISAELAERLLPCGMDTAKEGGRYRLIPCRTAEGEGILEGFRLDSIYIGDKKQIGKTVAAVSRNISEGDYSAIIGPDMLP